jgi:VIT1/CCC1 family predicted Fe2+/Mn2+ transporter
MDKKDNNTGIPKTGLSMEQSQPSQEVMNRQIHRSDQPPKQGQAPAGQSFFQKVKQSLYDSIGNIVFGMEDGTVSIFGLVFGLASTAQNSHQVLLAGATGAAAAAVSMMAGTYLDVQSTKAKAQSEIEHERQEVQQKPQEEEKEAAERLRQANFNEQEVNRIMSALRNNPDALLKFEIAYELQIGSAAKENPIVQSIWMFLADLIAASVPVIPFAFFALPTARIVSLVITGILVLILGIARAAITKSKVWSTVLETLLIAGAAGAAGVLIGSIIGG